MPLRPFNDRLTRQYGRLIDALTDPARRGWTMGALFVLYVLAWTLYGALAKASQDVHPDMTEIFAWSRELALGYAKHPPLAPYAVWLWFPIFPAADWAYYLLAMTMPGLTLFIAWRIALRYLDPARCAASVLLLTLIPFFNFHALKFNANTVLMPVWAATILWFLISFETRSRLYAVLAGAGAAAAMLGKYWSIVLLLGLGVAALLDARRADYFRSRAPWLTVAAGALCLAPHVMWLVANDFAPFSYAMLLHGAKPFSASVAAALGYLGGALGYAALPLVFVALVFRPGAAVLSDIAWPPPQGRRLLALIFWLPLLLPALLAPPGGTTLNSLWSMPCFTLFGIVLLSSPLLAVSRQRLVPLLATALVVPLIMIAAAPAIAYVTQRNGVAPVQAHGSLIAREAEALWRETTKTPLRRVCGHMDLAYGISFYSEARPAACPGPQILDGDGAKAAFGREGVLLVCFERDGCKAMIDRVAHDFPGARSRAVELSRRFLGIAGPAERYWIAALPPRG